MPPDLYAIQIFANFLAIFLGPVTAVCITLWIQNRKETREAKLQLFLTLLTERKDVTFSKRAIDALNTIDVVFHDNQKIVELWHKHFVLRQGPPTQELQHTWTELLDEMAKVLRFSNLRQIDLDKFYTTQGQFEQAMIQKEIQAEWLRVLKETKCLSATPKDVPPT